MTASTDDTWDDLVAEVRRVWGDGLEPVRPELIRPEVSARTREFLVTVGLPKDRILDIFPIRDERMLNLVSRGDRQYLTIATNEDTATYYYGVDVATGVVMFLDEKMSQFDCMANSNLAAFVLILGMYKRHYFELERLTKSAVADAVDAIYEQLGEWDSDALGDDESRWNILLDEHLTQYDD